MFVLRGRLCEKGSIGGREGGKEGAIKQITKESEGMRERAKHYHKNKPNAGSFDGPCLYIK